MPRRSASRGKSPARHKSPGRSPAPAPAKPAPVPDARSRAPTGSDLPRREHTSAGITGRWVWRGHASTAVASALATAAALALWGSCGGEWPPRGVVQSVRDGMGLAESAMGMGDGAGGADGPLWGRVSGFASVEDHASFKTISHEEVRKYWDERPCNSGWRFDGVSFGTKEHWEEVTRRKYRVEYHIPAFAEFEKWRGKRVLEVGGGICTTATSFAKAGAFVTVAELSPKSLAMCKERFKVMGLEDQATFYEVNAEQLSSVVPVEEFDLVWSFGVIHHSPNPDKIIQEVRKYMGQKTVLKLMVYSKISFKLFWVMNHTNQWDFAKMDEVVAHYSEAREGSPVTYTYSLRGFATLLDGLRVDYMGKAHIFPYEISAYKKSRYVVDNLWRHVSASRWEELEEELGWHLLAEARLSPAGDLVAAPEFCGKPRANIEGLRGVLPYDS